MWDGHKKKRLSFQFFHDAVLISHIKTYTVNATAHHSTVCFLEVTVVVNRIWWKNLHFLISLDFCTSTHMNFGCNK